jgi:Zn-dependent membrane protease YugP
MFSSRLEEEIMFLDYTFILLIPALILAFYAQAKVKGAYRKYSQIMAASRISGARAAYDLLQAAGAGDVKIEKLPGAALGDHYDPRKQVLSLSAGVYDSTSVAALGIAAHEAGHAIQHQSHYQPLHLRTLIYPVANLGSTLAFPLFFIGFIFSRSGPSVLMDIGILLFAAAVAFSVITLPVEFNASKRALVLLEERHFLTPQELGGAREVLKAAALTYVASTAMAAMQLLRMLLLRQSRD